MAGWMLGSFSARLRPAQHLLAIRLSAGVTSWKGTLERRQRAGCSFPHRGFLTHSGAPPGQALLRSPPAPPALHSLPALGACGCYCFVSLGHQSHCHFPSPTAEMLLLPRRLLSGDSFVMKRKSAYWHIWAEAKGLPLCQSQQDHR